MTTLAEFMIVSGAENCPPMLDKAMYNSWKSRMFLFIKGKKNGRMMLESIENGPLVYPTIKVDDPRITDCHDVQPTIIHNASFQTDDLDAYDSDYDDISSAKVVLMTNLLSYGSDVLLEVPQHDTYQNDNMLNQRLYNDIYSIVDACLNACEMWKAIERLKQGESINVQDLETNLYWQFGKFTSRDGETLKSYYSRFYKMMNDLVRNQCDVTNHQVNVQFLLQLQPEWQRPQQAATKNKGETIANSPQPTYDQEPEMLAEDDALSKEKDIDRLMTLISLSFKKIYKPTYSNLITSSNTRIASTLSVHGTDSRGYSKCSKNSRHIFDVEPLQKVQNDDDNYNVFANDREHPEQPEFVNDTYPDEQGNTNITTDSLDMSNNGKEAEQDNDDDLARECDLLAFLIVKLKCEIDDSKNRNKLLESSNKTLVDKLKGMMKFGNDQIALILGYEDPSTCYIRDLKGNDLLTGSCGIDLYSITLQDASTPNLICLMAKASSSQAWLWHRHLSHLNFDTINLLSKYGIVNDLPKLKFIKDHFCSSCESRKAKPETVTTSNELDFLFSLMFDELLNGTTTVVSKSSTVTVADAPDQRQQHKTTPSTSTTVATDTPPLNI
nr:hypothetical protein [Tanacetum cinerariifolium]